MREIKFRAWDSFNNIMIQNDRILKIYFVRSNHIPNLVVYSTRNIENRTEIREKDKQCCNEFELMQYTGLKDKNGKEIYEGDIILWKDKSPMSDGTLNEIVEVFWSDEFLKWSIKGNLNNAKTYIADLYDYSNTEEIEIIGNIYVNKELIRDENK